MDIFDLIDIVGTGPLIEEGPKLPSKRQRRKVEKVVREVSETAGDITEGCNNIIDTGENLAEAIHPIARLINCIRAMSVSEALGILEEGDHIKVMRSAYSHHGIYIGKRKVIEYNDGIVQESTLIDFANGDNILLVNEPTEYSKEEIVQRAKSRLGEFEYNLLYNNCENFATWCRCGGKG